MFGDITKRGERIWWWKTEANAGPDWRRISAWLLVPPQSGGGPCASATLQLPIDWRLIGASHPIGHYTTTMFSRTHKLSTRGEEEKLLGRTSHELTIRSAASLTPTAAPPSPQSNSPLAPARHSYYLRGNIPSVMMSVGSVASAPDVSAGPPLATDPSPTIINDPFTGEQKAKLVPDGPGVTGSPFSVFEDGGPETATHEKFWAHVVRIRELQSEV